MGGNALDLISLFGTVTDSLRGKQTELNKADDYNQNHGDNMVEIFEVITQAMREKKNADPADQLEYASQILRKKSQSGSAQLYSSGLAQAAQQFVGKQVTSGNALTLIQSLMGGGQAPPPVEEPANPLGSLLSGLVGGGQAQEDDSGFDAGDLLSAGMAFLTSKQSGKSDTEAIIDALISGSQMGSSAHRAQSGTLVTQTLLDVIGSLAG
ncbi:MAG: hypothetical protein OEV06_11280 [Anaerolineae bacterium]|nr:hypothetical protein [Anaerolineae bacterium]